MQAAGLPGQHIITLDDQVPVDLYSVLQVTSPSEFLGHIAADPIGSLCIDWALAIYPFSPTNHTALGHPD